MVKSFSIIILSSLFFISCSLNNRIKKYEEGFRFFAPPGTKQIGENIFIDENEISISGYAVYLNWLERVYGTNSERVNVAMPDSSIIAKVFLIH